MGKFREAILHWADSWRPHRSGLLSKSGMFIVAALGGRLAVAARELRKLTGCRLLTGFRLGSFTGCRQLAGYRGRTNAYRLPANNVCAAENWPPLGAHSIKLNDF